MSSIPILDRKPGESPWNSHSQLYLGIGVELLPKTLPKILQGFIQSPIIKHN